MSAPAETLVLTRRDIAALVTPADYLCAAEQAFRALASGQIIAPEPMHLQGHGGVFHVKGACLDGSRQYAAIKLNGNFPQNPGTYGLPTIQGAILLADAENGALLAIMDSIEITLQRTAAASALAARHLARPESSRIAICGCGEQGRVQLIALAAIFELKAAAAWDRNFERARAYADEMQKTLGVTVRATSRLDAATADADIVVTCTTARAPFLGCADVRKGAFIAAIGADNPDKSEIAPELMAHSQIVVDVLGQCLTMGDLHHAVAAGAVTPGDVSAELGQIVSGQKGGRTNADEIWIFDSTGTAAQDVTAAVQVYRQAAERGIGTYMSFATP